MAMHTEVGIGRLFKRGLLVAEAVHYERVIDEFSRRTHWIRIHPMPATVGQDDPLVVELTDGRQVSCRRADGTDLCLSDDGRP